MPLEFHSCSQALAAAISEDTDSVMDLVTDARGNQG